VALHQLVDATTSVNVFRKDVGKVFVIESGCRSSSIDSLDCKCVWLQCGKRTKFRLDNTCALGI